MPTHHHHIPFIGYFMPNHHPSTIW
jgi:hypothetical protein